MKSPPNAPGPIAGMPDTFGRLAQDLRVSVTDRRNLRCSDDELASLIRGDFIQPERPMSSIGG